MADLKAYSFATGGPCGAIPREPASSSQQASTPATSGGWQVERALGPQPGIDLIDRMVTAADQRERRQAQQPDAMQAMMQMLIAQSQQIAALAALVLRDDKSKAKPKQSRPKHERRQHRE